MSSGPMIAQRYAKALHGLVHEKGSDKVAYSQLMSLSKLMTADAQIYEYFSSPLVALGQKKEVLSAALNGQGLLEDVLNLLVVMADRNRLGLVPEIARAFQEILDQEQGLTRGVIKSSRPLGPEVVSEIEARISQSMKRKVVLSFEENPEVLGGIVTEVDGWTFDDSLETHLQKLNDLLNRSAQ